MTTKDFALRAGVVVAAVALLIVVGFTTYNFSQECPARHASATKVEALVADMRNDKPEHSWTALGACR